MLEETGALPDLILIDGGWLQGIASPALIHTTVGRMLFHVLVEEIGEGRAEEHHANIYRDLLAAMGEAPPPVESWEFARWERLNDASFDVPANIETRSLTFGRTGDEQSLAFCNGSPGDVNGDGFLDLICYSDTGLAGLQSGDGMGILKAKPGAGVSIAGSDSVHIVQ